ncbi:MAG: hypothetical protein L6W00_06280 [Lentisphaeria bacterium]|nr:MAG: hypothetical protein L6W00_06280 [Lentisphaeria bacterium]
MKIKKSVLLEALKVLGRLWRRLRRWKWYGRFVLSGTAGGCGSWRLTAWSVSP